MPAPLARRIIGCLIVVLPAVLFRLTGFAPDPVLDLVVFGAAVVAASFLLAWAAEGWDQVHREADVLEHAVSDLVLSRMDDELGHPERDPHGDPIPGADGSLPVDATVGLVDLAREQGGTVARISDRQPQILRYLRDRGITPDTVLTVTEVNTAAASLIVDRRAKDSGIVVPVEVSTAAASTVRVQPGSAEADPVSG